MKKVISFLSLFTSFGTLFCCALPALFVVLGFGASFAGLVGVFPQIITLSENKGVLFLVGGILLLLAGFFQWKFKAEVCPIDMNDPTACQTTKDWSFKVYLFSLGLYGLGAFFAFLAPVLLEAL